MPSFDPNKVDPNFIEFVESVQSQIPGITKQQPTMQEFYNSQEPLSALMTKVEGMSLEEAEMLSAKTFIPAAEIQKMAGMTALNGVGVGFRPVNEAAKFAMEEHGAIGKGFDIHGKSATEGPIRGLVPANPSFSKLGSNNDEAQIHQYEKVNKEALTNPDLGLYTPKSKDGKEYHAFSKDGLPLKDEKGAIIYAHQDGDKFVNILDGSTVDSKGYKAEVVKTIGYVQRDGKGQTILDEKGAPVVKPATADADQLTQGFLNFTDDYKSVGADITAKIGQANPESAALSQALISETKEKGLVRHSDESGNPYPENFSNGPHLFLVPEAKRDQEGNIIGIKSKGIVCNGEQEVIDKIYNNPEMKEFNFKANPLWGWVRDAEGNYQIDPNRQNAQAMYIKTGLIKDEIKEKENEIKNMPKSEGTEQSTKDLAKESNKSNELRDGLTNAQKKLADAEQITSLARERGKFMAPRGDTTKRSSFELEADLRLKTAEYNYNLDHGASFLPNQRKPDTINVDSSDPMQAIDNNNKEAVALNKAYNRTQEVSPLQNVQVQSQVGKADVAKQQSKDGSTSQLTDGQNTARNRTQGISAAEQSNTANKISSDLTKSVSSNKSTSKTAPVERIEAAKQQISQNSISQSTETRNKVISQNHNNAAKQNNSANNVIPDKLKTVPIKELNNAKSEGQNIRRVSSSLGPSTNVRVESASLQTSLSPSASRGSDSGINLKRGNERG